MSKNLSLKQAKLLLKSNLSDQNYPNPHLQAELLLGFITQLSREELLSLEPEFALSAQEVKVLTEIISQLRQQTPIAYLLGVQDFLGYELKVTPDTLIPRPETELLAQKAIELIQSLHKTRGKINIVEVGVGSAAITIGVSKNLNMKNIPFSYHGLEISSTAYNVAKENLQTFGLTNNVVLEVGNITELASEITSATDIVISNPPYIPSKVIGLLDHSVKNYEPLVALDGGIGGLDVYEVIAQKFSTTLPALALELDPSTATSVVKLFIKYGWSANQLELSKDQFDNIRFLTTRI